MTPKPELGWEATLGMLVLIVLLIAGIIAYHRWLDRRLKRPSKKEGD